MRVCRTGQISCSSCSGPGPPCSESVDCMVNKYTVGSTGVQLMIFCDIAFALHGVSRLGYDLCTVQLRNLDSWMIESHSAVHNYLTRTLSVEINIYTKELQIPSSLTGSKMSVFQKSFHLSFSPSLDDDMSCQLIHSHIFLLQS